MSDMSEINILGNPDFTEGLDDWHTHGWYEGNTINWISSGGISGSACIELAVPAQLGQSYIYQSVQLLPGTYTAKIHAKKISGNADVWIQVYAGEWFYSPSLRSQINEDSYTEISFQFTINVSCLVQIRYIAGSAEGVVRFDGAVLMAGVNDLTPGTMYYANVHVGSSGLRVRSLPSANGQTLGYWPNGRKAVVTGITGSNEWVECRWHDHIAYVARSYLTNVVQISNIYNYGEILNVVGAAEKTTGTHNVKYYATGYDSGSLWCHLFADWIVGHCIWDSSYLPNVANCRQGVISFLQEDMFVFVNSWHKNDVWENCAATSEWMDSAVMSSFESSYVPSAGDYVYFRKYTGQCGYTPTETSYHVGVVVACTASTDGCTVTVVEGNSSGENVQNGVGIITYLPDASSTGPASGGRFHPNILGFGFACGLG